MAALNTTMIQGRLTADADLRFLSSGVALMTFSIAHARNFQKNGEWQREVSFVDCKAFGDTVSRISSDMVKGLEVVVVGRLSQESWQSSDGTKRSKLLIIADRVDCLPARQPQRAAARQQPAASTQDDDDLPF